MILRAKCDILDTEKQLFIYLDNNHYWFNGETQSKLYYEPNVNYPGYEFISCTCVCYHINYICKHAVALSVKLGKFIMEFIPTEYFANLSKSNQKTKVTPALVIDSNNQQRRAYKRN